jgi:hypothetical protein
VLTLSFHRETVLDALLNDRQEFGNTERAIVCGVSPGKSGLGTGRRSGRAQMRRRSDFY